MFLAAPMPEPGTGEESGAQEREILSGGMNPVSPRALSATQPSGRTTRWVMLPLLRERRSQPSGGNCSALGRGGGRMASSSPPCRPGAGLSDSIYGIASHMS